MAIGFSDMTPEGKRFFKELRALEKMEVRVGFQRGEAVYEESEEGKEGADLVDVAAFNELGSSDTPARPFMRQSFENHEADLKKACENANKIISSGGTAQQALNRIGVVAKGLVQDEIANGSFEPNAPSTIAKKGSERPLIDTGFMRENVNFVIKGRGE